MNEPRRQYGTIAGAEGVAIDQGLRQYMLGVYNYMALGVAVTGIVTMAITSNLPLMQTLSGIFPILFLALIGLSFVAPRVIFAGSKPAAHGMFWLNAALWGALIAPALASFQMAGASQEIYRAFFISASIFAGMSLWGYTTKKDMSGWAGVLSVTSLVLLGGIGVQMIFLKSSLFSVLLSSAIVVFVSLVTGFQTQQIKSMYLEGSATNDRASIFGAYALFSAFASLFINILNILGFFRD